MALVPEDGSGLETANGYISQAFADTHHSDRNNTAWADFESAQKDAAIIRASDYVDKRFGRKFRGSRESREQGLEWPRLSAYDNDGYSYSGDDAVPRNLQKAVAEYALRAAQIGVLAPDPNSPVPAQSMETGAVDRDTAVVTGEVTRERSKVGPIEEETWYKPSAEIAGKNLGVGAKNVQSGILNDFVIPEYPEADMWIEELLESSTSTSLVLS